MSEPPGSAASALTPATAPAALGHSSSQRSSVDNLSEGRSRSASPGKKNPFAKMADKIGGLFQKKKDRRPSATSDLSADSSQTGSRRMSTSSSVDEQRQRPPPSPVPPASILVTSGKAPWGSIPILDPTSPTTFSPVAVALIVDDHSHPHMTEEPVSEQLAGPAYIDKTPIEPPVRLVEEPDQRPSLYDYDDYADSGASSSEESSDEEHVRPRGRKPRSAAARMSGWFRRLSLSPLPRTLSEPTREDPAVVQHSDTFARTATLGVPSASGVANRSRSVGATGGGSGRRDSNEMGRPVSITFDVDEGRTQEGRRQARARSSDDKSRRNSIFSLFSGKGDNTDSESVGGSIFSFGKRRKTDGSVGTQSAAPIFVEPPLPPLMLSGRYSDAKTVLDEATAEEIRKHLPRRLREAVKWPLLYSMDMHGTAFSSFYLLTQGKGPTIWAFEDTKGVIFGVFVSEDIEMVPAGGGFYGTGERWVFIIRCVITVALLKPSGADACHQPTASFGKSFHERPRLWSAHQPLRTTSKSLQLHDTLKLYPSPNHRASVLRRLSAQPRRDAPVSKPRPASAAPRPASALNLQRKLKCLLWTCNHPWTTETTSFSIASKRNQANSHRSWRVPKPWVPQLLRQLCLVPFLWSTPTHPPFVFTLQRATEPLKPTLSRPEGTVWCLAVIPTSDSGSIRTSNPDIQTDVAIHSNWMVFHWVRKPKMSRAFCKETENSLSRSRTPTDPTETTPNDTRAALI